MEWNFAPDVIKAAQEIGIGDRVVAHWTEAECQDQAGTVVGVEIHRYGKVEYTVHLDGDISTTDGFTHDRSGTQGGTIRLLNRAPDHIPNAGKMVLVPREPTPEMIEAGRWPAEDDGPAACYRAMLSAAPQPSLEGEAACAVAAMGELAEHLDLAEGVYELEASVCRKVAALLQSLSADNARLREERDKAVKLFRALQEAVTGDVKAEARLSQAVEVLKPFADASANLDDSHPDGSSIWESPAAMGIDAKHLRAAQSFLDTQGGGNG